ncbi:MAG: TonB-dependent receptor [Candidatus Omnitrophota bacterium]
MVWESIKLSQPLKLHKEVLNPAFGGMKFLVVMKKALISFIILSSIFSAPYSLFAEEQQRALEKIVVSPGMDSLGPSMAKSVYSAQILDSGQIKMQNPDSLADLLQGISGADLRYRGTSGIQGDLSLRGSTFEQVAVLIDGIRVNDPQTGHHNLDIPLTEYDLQRLEVIKDGDSSLYGAGGLAGSVNFVVKRPVKRGLRVDSVFGQHALFGQGFSLTLPERSLSGRLSYEHKISKAARPNTDFEYYTTSLYLNKDINNALLDALFGYQKKDFGADSFYSNLFCEEEEHTETFFTKAGLDNQLGSALLKNNLFFRRHWDKFILQRNNPTSVNYHTTYIYGLVSRLNLPTGSGEAVFGLDLGREEINSTNLGKHSRLYEAFLAGFTPGFAGRLNIDLRARADHYQKWGWQESYNFGLEYPIIDDRLSISGSAARSFRVPSYTELYYNTAANKGNPALTVEHCDNFKLGLDFKDKGLEVSIDGFMRRGHGLIDWTRTSEQDPWVATNLGSVDFRGAEFISAFSPQLNFKEINLKKLQFSYAYIDVDKKTSGFFSKYALDALKHQLLLDIYSSLFGLKVDWQLSYNQRYYGETYFVGGLYLSKTITKNNFSLEPFVKVDNFTNTSYSEISGVILPGRWIKGGVKFEW